MSKPWILLLLILFVKMNTSAQELKNIKIDFLSNTQVHIFYDLNTPQKDQLYKVSLFGLVNNVSRELIQISGDAGEDIKPGLLKKITWNPQAEFSRFKGEVVLEVRATLTFAPLLSKYALSGSYKRKEVVPLEWSGGVAGESVNLELFQGTNKITAITTLPNTNFYNWTIPGDIPKGTGYQVKISSANRPDNNFMTSEFAIKSKLPLLLKLLPVAVIAGAGAVILGGGGGDNGGTQTASKLPDPPNPK